MNTEEYDSVRGAFIEGKRIYPNSGFYEKHIFKSVSETQTVSKDILLQKRERRF